MAENAKQYSMVEFEALMETIKARTELTEIEISTKAGYKDKNYLAQVRSKKKVSPLLMDRLKTKFAYILEKPNSEGEKSNVASNKPNTSGISAVAHGTSHSSASLSSERNLIAEYVDSLKTQIKEAAEISNRLHAIEQRQQEILLKLDQVLSVSSEPPHQQGGTPDIVVESDYKNRISGKGRQNTSKRK